MSLTGLLGQALSAAMATGERQDRVLAGGLCVRVYADPPRVLLWRDGVVPGITEAQVIARDLGWPAGQYEVVTHEWSGVWTGRPAGMVVRQLRTTLHDQDPRLNWTPEDLEVCGTCGRWAPELDGSALGACELGWAAHDAFDELVFVSLHDKKQKPYGPPHPNLPQPLTSRGCHCRALQGGKPGWIPAAPLAASSTTAPKGRPL
ncbi:hypothetical protein [Deinococcus peraridilitoris]|uniref:Uncharacterized protein n=1 Tax=Deinococcus peraridilitoris (strain DSM 19664 / LMG 22246 / CIP 109416 / KR-200) TaxID=937777 RepID=K9ZZE0_DEIPD|nr:hypothetical protein [Deinococcus peraridilitoris]AFZ67013.1 hypothetical protein Deipe_1472 [Deinococcus peraridilitoris DSM 19664]